MKHSTLCKMAFGRPTKTEGACPRCDELRSGAAPRKGWGVPASVKRAQEERFGASLRAHNCVQAGCSVVCTFGDW